MQTTMVQLGKAKPNVPGIALQEPHQQEATFVVGNLAIGPLQISGKNGGLPELLVPTKPKSLL